MPKSAPTILLIPGSSRDGSTNVAVLRIAAVVPRRGIATSLSDGLGALPLSNPDDDRDGTEIDSRVAGMRRQVSDADQS